jgi:prolyl-tRNA synthetase
LIWPLSVAPFQVHIVSLAKNVGTVAAASAELYEQCSKAGIEAILDDRAETPGVKFNDADLIGVPLRLTVGQRSLKQGRVEMKLRHDDARVEVALEEVVSRVRSELKAMQGELDARVVEVEYENS